MLNASRCKRQSNIYLDGSAQAYVILEVENRRQEYASEERTRGYSLAVEAKEMQLIGLKIENHSKDYESMRA